MIEEVATEFRVPVEILGHRGRSPARKALAQLGRHESGLTLRSIAEWMGTTEWAISKLTTRSQELAEKDPSYRDALDRIRARLKS